MRDRIYELEAAGSWKVLYLDTVDSTNTRAKKEALEGAADHTVVIADCQTAGRGRRGRSFDSARGQGIFLSLILRPEFGPDRASMLTLVAGLSVRRALSEQTGLAAQIKWPNDLVIHGRKLCGILTEMSAKPDGIAYLVVGIGVNVNQKEFPEELKSVATSVFQESGKDFDRVLLIEEILRWFDYYYEQFVRAGDLSGLRAEYQSYMINLGQEVVVEQGGNRFTAIATGIDSDGELLIERDGVPEKVLSGEVSVRGVYGYV